MSVGFPFVVFARLVVGIIPDHVRKDVPGGRERHNPRAFRCPQRWQEALIEREVTEVIGAELALPSRADAGERAGHDPGIVNQQMHLALGCDMVVCKFPDAGKVGKVHRRNSDAVDAGQGLARCVRAPRRNGHARASSRQGANGLKPDAGIPPVTTAFFPERSIPCTTSCAVLFA